MKENFTTKHDEATAMAMAMAMVMASELPR